MNPKRVCGVCGETPDMVKLVAMLPKIEPYTVEYNIGSAIKPEFFNAVEKALVDLRRATECPVCTLAALRQAGIAGIVGSERFDFKVRMQEWWDEENRREYERDLYLG